MSILDTALSMLKDQDVPVPEDAVGQLQRHADLVTQWNDYASLVSQGDKDDLLARHTIDALSLAPWVRRHAGAGGLLLDIGSGGGFPALPLKIVLPSLRMVLVERSAKKVGVLRRILVALSLDDVTLRNGVFPAEAADLTPTVITARAVERPVELWRNLGPFLGAGQAFLCQTGDVSMVDAAAFHVEPIEDTWGSEGLRRGALHVITRRSPEVSA